MSPADLEFPLGAGPAQASGAGLCWRLGLRAGLVHDAQDGSGLRLTDCSKRMLVRGSLHPAWQSPTRRGTRPEPAQQPRRRFLRPCAAELKGAPCTVLALQAARSDRSANGRLLASARAIRPPSFSTRSELPVFCALAGMVVAAMPSAARKILRIVRPLDEGSSAFPGRYALPIANPAVAAISRAVRGLARTSLATRSSISAAGSSKVP